MPDTSIPYAIERIDVAVDPRFHVVAVWPRRRVSALPLRHDDAVSLSERLNREAGCGAHHCDALPSPITPDPGKVQS